MAAVSGVCGAVVVEFVESAGLRVDSSTWPPWTDPFVGKGLFLLEKLLNRLFDPAVRLATLLASAALFLNTLPRIRSLK
jgi:hypothetical protein